MQTIDPSPLLNGSASDHCLPPSGPSVKVGYCSKSTSSPCGVKLRLDPAVPLVDSGEPEAHWSYHDPKTERWELFPKGVDEIDLVVDEDPAGKEFSLEVMNMLGQKVRLEVTRDCSGEPPVCWEVEPCESDIASCEPAKLLLKCLASGDSWRIEDAAGPLDAGFLLGHVDPNGSKKYKIPDPTFKIIKAGG